METADMELVDYFSKKASTVLSPMQSLHDARIINNQDVLLHSKVGPVSTLRLAVGV